ncbi:MAG: right-handed parallel beta-helix repeat-containing protein [Anaerolineae bacterium]
MREITLEASQVTSASEIQAAIDALGAEGGRVVLPALEVELDRGIELRSSVTLVGQGRKTLLRKAPGRVYPLSGYHNYGMLDVPLLHTEGLAPGMTVAIRDDRHGSFFETFARITWIDGTWVGLDRGLHSDYHADAHPVLVTAFPLVFGLGVENVAIRGLTLEGNREAQPAGIGACRGAAVYFLRSRGITVADVVERGFAGEGLGFQMCAQVYIRDCHFTANAGNGFHPGAGSTAATFDRCSAEGNGAAGFFFCVRANHITVRECAFADNVGPGVSVGKRDSYNLLEQCRIEGNGGPGILFRETRRPVAMESCAIRRCHIAGNARHHGEGQVVVLGDGHDLAFEENTIVGDAQRERSGLFIAPTVRRVWLAQNQIRACFPEIVADPTCLMDHNPVRACGIESVSADDYRHLGSR